MRTRALLLAGLTVATIAGAAGAQAPYCRVVRERAGDHDPRPARVGSYAPYDLKSADVATNAKSLTAVIRVGAVADDSPVATAEGAAYEFDFSLDTEHSYSFFVTTQHGPATWELYQSHTRCTLPEHEDEASGVHVTPTWIHLGGGTAVVDAKHGEYRATVPLSVFGKGVVTKGRAFGYFCAHSEHRYVELEPGNPLGWDSVAGTSPEDAISAPASARYPVGAPSCVRVGR